MRLTIDAPDWLMKRAMRAVKFCGTTDSEEIALYTDLSFKDAFELLGLMLEAAAEVALDSPEAAEPLEEAGR